MPAERAADYVRMLRKLADQLERGDAPRPPLPDVDTSSDIEVASIALGSASSYRWVIRSTCGVVKVWSSRDGCMVALAPDEARRIGESFHTAMCMAAEATDRATRGYVRAVA